MSHSFSLIAHRSDTNPILEQTLINSVQYEIDTKRGIRRYRRLVFYFFEKEITADITTTLQQQSIVYAHRLLDVETQAILARSALHHSAGVTTPWHTITVLLNNYLLGQDEFSYDNKDSDTVFAQQIEQHMSHKKALDFFSLPYFSSDILLILRRKRADLLLIQQLLSGTYGYRTLVQACGDYLAEFGMIPYMFSYLEKDRSSDSFLSFLEEDSQQSLSALLMPQYELGFQKITLSDSYGVIHVEKTPYATILARFGHRRSLRPWWIKILLSVGIVIVSGFFGGRSLIILPIVWGLIQGATSSWNYLHTLSRMFTTWYHHYTIQHQRYVDIYEQMIDPERSTSNTLQSEQLMNDRYDMTPFGGHELNRDVQTHSQKIVSFYSRLLSDSSLLSDCKKEFSQILAITDRSYDHSLPLWIVSSSLQNEQSYYRLLQLIETTKQTHLVSVEDDLYYQYYDAITEIVDSKTLKFTSQNWLRGLSDGALVAASSGVLGWLGSYLRNRNMLSSHAFAAGASVTATSSFDQLPGHLDKQLLNGFEKVLTSQQIDVLTHVVTTDTVSDTVWQTLTKAFGHQVGNATNTAMMDNRWRAVDQFGDSELLTKAFANNLPLGPSDPHWHHLLSFLDRIYAYDNFASYQPLVHQQWLPDTLQGLHNGTLTLSDFAQLSQPQREILTQAAFTTLHKGDIVGLLLDNDIDTIVSPVSGSIIDNVILTGVSDHNLTGVVLSGDFITGQVVPDLDIPSLSSGMMVSGSHTTGTITSGNISSSTGSLITQSSQNILDFTRTSFSGMDFFSPWNNLYSGLVQKFNSLFSGFSLSSLIDTTSVPPTDIVLTTGESATTGGVSLSGNTTITGIDTLTSSLTPSSLSWIQGLKNVLRGLGGSGEVVSGTLSLHTGVVSTGVISTEQLGSGSDILLSGGLPEVNVILPSSHLPSFTLPIHRSNNRLRQIIKNHLQL